MESFALELFPNHGQVHMALFENVTNASELKHRLINQDTALTCALIDASFVIDRFHALLATNRAVHEEQSQKLKTYNLYSQIIFNFSPNTNIAKSFQQFGIKENTTSVVAIKVGDSADEAESFMKNCIKGNLVSLDQLSVIRDLKSIKNAYQIEEKEDVERVKSIVAGAIALKVFNMMEVDQVNLNGISGDSQPITGIIYPPQNVRTMIDKAAAHLATKPPELAKHILENDKEGKFSFLKEGDPYHAYYLFKFNESKEGRAPQMSEQVGEQTVHMHEEQKVDLAPKKPEEFLFSAPLPAMSAQDLDIIKLTAQFAARNGLGFIGQLMKRESRNYQFDFLHSNHSLFPYFTQLIEQYTKVLKPSNDILGRLHANQADKYHILDRVKERVEYVAWQEAEKKKKSDEDEKERIAYASIDWHDFVVVETVEFTDADEHADLPPPMSLAELESMSLAQKRMAAMPEPTKEETVSAEEMKVDMDMDDVDMEASDDEMTEQPPAPASVIVPKIPEVSGPIKIRTDYKPKLMGAATNKATVPMQTCPRCGETIPVSEMDEHMRIELLDPKWKEQKMAMEAKHKDSNLLHGTDVAKNLKNFSGLRPDIFDADESETLRKFKQQEEEAKKKDKIIWDGHTATMTLANQRAQKSSIEEQIAQMHRGIKAPTDTIGPQIPGQAYPSAYPQPPMYYPNRTLVNQVPGMYNPGMPGMPMPQPPVGPPPMPMTPAVRKADELGPGAEKKPRTEEPEWPLTDPNAITLTIQTPSLPDKPEWNLTGAPISITGLLPNTLISTLKDRIASQLGMPAGKQKLSTMGAGTVLNNSKTLAFYGIMNGAALVLEVRKR